MPGIDFSTTFLIRIRSVLRRCVFIPVFGAVRKMRSLFRRFYYRIMRPARLILSLNGIRTTLLVTDCVEYDRVLDFKQDRKIIRSLIENLKEGDICWDIGASVGVYTLFFAEVVGKTGLVVSFEPESRSLRRLNQNVEANRLTNVLLFHVALGQTKAKMQLNVSSHYSFGTHSLTDTNQIDCGDSYEEVEVIPGDELRKDRDLGTPQVIKIDVEGWEEKVILGLKEILSHVSCRCVMCEINFSVHEKRGLSQTPSEIVMLLKSFGFNEMRWLDYSHVFFRKTSLSKV